MTWEVSIPDVTVGCHPDLHDRPGVGAVAGLRRRRATGVHQVGVAREVVVRRDACRDGRRRVVVEDQGLAGIGGEVDDDVGPLGRSEEERALVDVSDVEQGRVRDPANGLKGDFERRREPPALGADLPHFRSRVRLNGKSARRVRRLARVALGHEAHRDLGAVGRPVQVKE